MSRREFRGEPVVRVSAASLQSFNRAWREGEPTQNKRRSPRRRPEDRPLTARPLGYHDGKEEPVEPSESVDGGVRFGAREDDGETIETRDDAPMAALFDDPEVL